MLVLLLFSARVESSVTRYAISSGAEDLGLRARHKLGLSSSSQVSLASQLPHRAHVKSAGKKDGHSHWVVVAGTIGPGKWAGSGQEVSDRFLWEDSGGKELVDLDDLDWPQPSGHSLQRGGAAGIRLLRWNGTDGVALSSPGAMLLASRCFSSSLQSSTLAGKDGALAEPFSSFAHLIRSPIFVCCRISSPAYDQTLNNSNAPSSLSSPCHCYSRHPSPTSPCTKPTPPYLAPAND
ncbi:hypothetical protein CCHR01_07207 [Colletotrichum chrysophilum]|uniref:Uncharacterized protein n=1 Tax=Colletotrichum chrysophilum TaxID=1836956 RepID=A0AAD9AKX7_9PEZI|nr:hypothetical protein CCHR01_07207 [Colletotrichum chrysophilum]